MKKKVLTFIMAIIFVFAMLPLSALAVTDVVIHKLLVPDGTTAKDYPSGVEPGSVLTQTQLNTMFGSASEMTGVKFAYYLVTPTQASTMAAAPASYDTIAEVNAYLSATPTGTTTATTSSGTTVSAMADGTYWFVEDLSSYTGAELIDKSIVAPFTLTLPVVGASGNLATVNLYPKNETSPITIAKTINGTGSTQSVAVGSTINWTISSAIPSNVGTATTYKIKDTLNSGLTFKSLNGANTITVGSQTLNVTSDFTVTLAGNSVAIDGSNTTAGGELVISFTSAGLAKLQTAYNAGTTILSIPVSTKLNGSSSSSSITNNASYEYVSANSQSLTKTTDSGSAPTVTTAGEKFLKQDSISHNALSGAVFTIHSTSNGSDASKTWTSEALTLNNAALLAGKFATFDGANYTSTSSGNLPTVGTTIYLNSDANGLFEYNGLADGTYYLKENKAPTGYAAPSNTISFTVSSSTYGDANTVSINNSKMTIPQTGGIGIIVLIVLGGALIGFAVYRLKKDKEEDKETKIDAKH